MTYNEKKRFLEKYTRSKRRILGLNNELEEWLTLATKTTQTLKEVNITTNQTNKRVEKCAIMMAQTEEKLLHEIEKSQRCMQDVQDAIDTIKDGRRRELLELRYIYGLPVWKIAIEWNKTENDIYKVISNTINSMKL